MNIQTNAMHDCIYTLGIDEKMFVLYIKNTFILDVIEKPGQIATRFVNHGHSSEIWMQKTYHCKYRKWVSRLLGTKYKKCALQKRERNSYGSIAIIYREAHVVYGLTPDRSICPNQTMGTAGVSAYVEDFVLFALNVAWI